ncbi:FAD dependent oxidoreductase-domain-containing protein [Aspergillus spectabilis]
MPHSASLPFKTLDVFTSTPFSGNPLAVVTLPPGTTLTQAQKLTIAREFNLSETTFVHEIEEDDCTPSDDLISLPAQRSFRFAGHPTIGTAATLYSRGVRRLRAKAGVIQIEAVVGGEEGGIRAEIPFDVRLHEKRLPRIRMQFQKYGSPLLEALVDAEHGAALFSIVNGMTFALIELPSVEVLGAVTTGGAPELPVELLDEGWRAGWVTWRYYFVRLGIEVVDGRTVYKLRSRLMRREMEDAGTGSAACALASYLSLHVLGEEGKIRFEMTQGVEMARENRILVDVEVANGVEGRRKLEKVSPLESEIVIIGAGYAGTSTAYHILDQYGPSSKPSIVILEARQVCSGATGRNGGHLKPDVYTAISMFASKYGVEAAAELAAFETAHIPALESVVKKENIPCDLQVSQAYDVQLDETHNAKLEADYRALIANGSDITKTAVYTSGKEAEAVSGVKGAKGCFSYRAGRLWPYKLITHLLKIAIAKGANLQTTTPVLEISNFKKDTWAVRTPRGSITTKQIVFASNAYTSAISPEYNSKIIPVRGICSRIVVPNSPAPPLDSSYVIRVKEGIYEYLIPRPDGSIVVGGARSAYIHDLNQWYNNVNDRELIDSAKQYFDGYMQKFFTGWEGSGAYTDRVWTGIMGYTTDSLPHVGQVPGKQGQFVVAGFNGHGMPQIFLSAKGVAEMVLKGVAFEETGVPRLFKTTQDRLDSKENDILGASYLAGKGKL